MRNSFSTRLTTSSSVPLGRMRSLECAGASRQAQSRSTKSHKGGAGLWQRENIELRTIGVRAHGATAARTDASPDLRHDTKHANPDPDGARWFLGMKGRFAPRQIPRRVAPRDERAFAQTHLANSASL